MPRGSGEVFEFGIWAYLMSHVEIKLKNSDIVALVDECDQGTVSGRGWFLMKSGYVVSYVYERGKSKTIYMHRLIMNAPEGYEVDHADSNKRNNTRANIRLATKSQNQMNTRKRGSRKSNLSSSFKGVSLHRKYGKYRARLRHEMIGWFDSPEEAARAYNKVAVEAFGPFARLNPVEPKFP